MNHSTGSRGAHRLTGSAVAQTSMPLAGLVAEGEGRWSDALAVYWSKPSGADSANLWLRIAEIEGTLRRMTAQSSRRSVPRPRGLEIRTSPARLSQAYAAAGMRCRHCMR